MSDPWGALILTIGRRTWSIGRARPGAPILLKLELRDEAEARAVGEHLLAAWAADDRPSDPESGGRPGNSLPPFP